MNSARKYNPQLIRLHKRFAVVLFLLFSFHSIGQNCQYELIGPGSELNNRCDAPDKSDWVLIFQDDFNGPRLDKTKWMSGYGWTDYAEEALYREENISFPVEGEMHFNINSNNFKGKGVSYLPSDAKIKLHDDVFATNERVWECTSAAIRSHRSFKYGKFEIRCWLPKGKVFFPAFWLFGGPSYSEIDIFEFKGQYNSVETNMYHNPDSDEGTNSTCQKSFNPLFKGKFSGKWHTYKMEWDQWTVTYFVDEKPLRTVYRFKNEKNKPITSLKEYDLAYPEIYYNKAFPYRPMHLIANLSMVPGEANNIPNSYMKVDYIKVWSKNSDQFYLKSDFSGDLLTDENHRYRETSSKISSVVDYVHESENSDFADVQGGDLDGDGLDEMISIRNSKGDILIHSAYKIDEKLRFRKSGHYKQTKDKTWSGITVGDIDNDGKAEILASRKSDGKIYIWDVAINKEWNGHLNKMVSVYELKEKSIYEEKGRKSEWVGIECGDFDQDGTVELAAISNNGSGLTLFKYNPTQNKLVSVNSLKEIDKNAKFADLTSGDFNGNGKDEIALANRDNNNVYIIELDKKKNLVVKSTYSWKEEISGWTSISAGKFKSSGVDQIVLHSKSENVTTITSANSVQSVFVHDYTCYYGVALGVGKFQPGCENFILVNNFGEFEVKGLLGECAIQNTGVPITNQYGLIEIKNSEGRTIIYKQFRNWETINKAISSLAKGEYQMKLKFEDCTFTQKLVK